MRVVVCAKEVLDPDAVNNYALAGHLEIGADGKSITQSAIPQLMNAYDEQAIEAALRLRDAGANLTLCVVSVGKDPTAILKHAAALGADEIVAIDVDASELDAHAIAAILSAYVRTSGGADLVLCGRQASDDDQGVVPALVAESLGAPAVTIVRAVELAGASTLRVTRVTPDGDELVEVACPAVVTISNELGDPRYPTTAKKIAARKMKPTVVSLAELGLAADAVAPRARLVRQFVPKVQGSCEMIAGASASEIANRLLQRLREESLLS